MISNSRSDADPTALPAKRSRWRWAAIIACLLAVFAGHLAAALHFANDEDEDGAYYELLARNVVVHGVFTGDSGPPLEPINSRMPGYPLFIAGIYKLCGIDHFTEIRIAQAFIHTITTILLSAIAWLWAPWPQHRWKAAILTFVLAAICPFTIIYAACILTETLTMFFVVVMVFCATLGWRGSGWRGGGWWLLAGLSGGLAEMLRPDAGLFVAAIGLTLVIGVLTKVRAGKAVLFGECKTGLVRGLLLSAGFILAVAPWIVRNAVVFHTPQLLPPMIKGEGAIEIAGFCAWFGTWSDDESELPGLYWNIDPDNPMKFSDLPAKAFDNEDERKRTEALFAEFNSHAPPVMMTNEIDREYARLARERIARNPLRSYLWLPLRRAVNLWCCTHSQYYPFEGALFPLNNPNGEFYRIAFSVLTWVYTILGLIGAWVSFRARGEARRWLCVVGLLVGLRMAMLTQLEHTEPRYVVEFFPFLSLLGGSALVHLLEAGGVFSKLTGIRFKRGTNVLRG